VKRAALAAACCVAALGMTLGIGSAAHAASNIPAKPSNKLLVDDSKSLTPETEQQVESDLDTYAQQTGNQVAVLLVKTTGNENIDDYAFDVGNSWGIGQRGSDNGVLFVLAMNDRQGRIEVGPGLQGQFTDIQASDILNQQVFPRLKAGDPNEAVVEGEIGIRQALGDPNAGTATTTQITTTTSSGHAGASIGGLVFIVFIIILSVLGRGRGLGGFGGGVLYGGGLGWGLGRGLGGGGGFGGGGGGGFGGFGGGGFNGGGASGGW
jgi:uncharacterized protein